MISKIFIHLLIVTSFSLSCRTAAVLLSQFKYTFQSSTYGTLDSSRAVDGDLATGQHTEQAHKPTKQYWRVDLGVDCYFSYVLLYVQANYRYRFNNVEFYRSSDPQISEHYYGIKCDAVTDTIAWTTVVDTDMQMYNSTSCSGWGRYFLLLMSGQHAQAFILLREIQVFGKG